MNTQTVTIGDRNIGPGEPCYLIAEVGTTCLGDIDNALKLISAIGEAGMDAAKFQVIDPEQLSDTKVEYEFSSGGVRQSANMKEMFQRLTFDMAQWKDIKAACQDAGVDFFATVDHLAGVDLLEEIGVDVHKMGAWDANYRPLVEKIARTGKPMFMDLGPCTEQEMDEFVSWFQEAGGDVVMFMHDYHTNLEEQMNMRAVAHLARKYPWPAGYSSPGLDHDLDFLALALGAHHMEKRLILSRSLPAFHADESLEPAELKQWVDRVRRAEKALGREAIVPSDKDRAEAENHYRSLCTIKPVKAGDLLGPENLDGKRPGTGISCGKIREYWGKRANRDLPENHLLCDQDLA